MKTSVRIMIGMLACSAAWLAHAQRYPSKPVRLIASYAPGGATDVLGRLVATDLSKALSSSVVVENRPGAGGRIGTRVCKSAPNDGYTLCLMSPAQAIAPTLFKDAGYDLGDFTYITQLAKVPNLLLVHPSLPVKSVSELIALARKNPGQLNYASSGGGSSAQLAMELLKQQANIDIVLITYKGTGAAIADQVAGRVEVAFNAAVGVVPFVNDGKLRLIAVSTLERFPMFPKVPTLHESGVKGFEGSSWQGIAAPAGVPGEIVTRLNREIVAILKTPTMREKVLELGGVVVGSSPAAFDAFFKAEAKKWSAVAAKAGLLTN
ncbi:MAG TPA: tripartite tricarboxylate transporter substrate binding protein [Burkholderiales bacterium]|nr:tripartite tricarboxylate transporter substrate binding protein [Burkholderiales bacterium]